MAGQRCEFELEDADGRRRVVLQSVVPGRRYVVGKGETCVNCFCAVPPQQNHCGADVSASMEARVQAAFFKKVK
jgi:hypothetical protein